MSYRNQALWDRLLHVAVGLAMLVAGWWLFPDGIVGAALRIFGIIPLVTGLIGWSPFYALFDWGTRPNNHRPHGWTPDTAGGQRGRPDPDRQPQRGRNGHPESG